MIFFTYNEDGIIQEKELFKVKQTLDDVSVELILEWGVIQPLSIHVSLMTSEKFKEDAKENSPPTWKYCFLLRDDDHIYINMEVFSVLPHQARSMIKHELAHVVILSLVGNVETYRKSFVLEEGLAGFDGATKLLVDKIRNENIASIPDPLSLDGIANIKALGADTNKEPFFEQLGYLVLFSFCKYLRKRHGASKMIEVYRGIVDEHTLASSYLAVCGEKIEDIVREWRDFVVKNAAHLGL